jgi:hypothetical protein
MKSPIEMSQVNQPSNEESQDPHRRLRELLAVPDRDRSDVIWGEINLLEIKVAFRKREMSSQAIPLNNQSQLPHRHSPANGRKPEKRYIKKQPPSF